MDSVIHRAAWVNYNTDNAAHHVKELPHGAVGNVHSVNQLNEILDISKELEHRQVMDNVWKLIGPAYAPIVIELDSGLIVCPTGEHAEEGAAWRKYIREKISTKPVIGVLYDHNHYVAGTKTLLDGDEAVIVAHPDMDDIILARSGGGQANIPIAEMEPHVASRAMIHYGNYNPESGRDAPLIPFKVELGHESAWLPSTLTVEDGESFEIGGLTFVAYHHETDTKDNMTFYIRSYDLVISNVVWPSMNLYTLRGDAYRDPSTWNKALRDIRDLRPEHVVDVGSGTKPLVGKEVIRDHINAILGARSFTYDQAIRLTNLGVPPPQLKHYMVMPKELRDSPFVNDGYGQYDTFPEIYPVHGFGYFSGLPHLLHNLPASVYSEYLVKLAGGIDATYRAFSKAMSKSEFLWAKELAVAMYYLHPGEKRYRQMLADVLRRLGQLSEGLIARNFYIAGARCLEGDSDVTLMGTQSAEWVEGHLDLAVDYLRTRLNPDRAEGKSGILVFHIEGKRLALEVRNSTAEVPPKGVHAKGGPVIKVSAKEFARYYVGEIPAKDIASGQALKLLELFDEYTPISMYPESFKHLG